MSNEPCSNSTTHSLLTTQTRTNLCQDCSLRRPRDRSRQGLDRVTNVLIEDGRIARLRRPAAAVTIKIIDAAGKIVAPGLIDMHVHLREPGAKRTRRSRPARRRRWRADSPRSPACPTPSRRSTRRPRSSSSSSRRPGPTTATCSSVACVSKNREGKELAEIGSLVEAGAVAFSDAIAAGAEPELAAAGARILPDVRQADPQPCRGAGADARRRDARGAGLAGSGLAGMPAEAEDVMTGRDIRLAEATGGRAAPDARLDDRAASTSILPRASSAEVNLTCSVCPLNFTLTDESLRDVRLELQAEPAAARPRSTSRPASPAWPTARST